MKFTPNFGWPVAEDVDVVKQYPATIDDPFKSALDTQFDKGRGYHNATSVGGTIPQGVETSFVWTVVETDNALYTPAGGDLTVSRAGYYIASIVVSTSAAALSTQRAFVAIYGTTNGQDRYLTPMGMESIASATGILWLAANGQIMPRIMQNSAPSWSINHARFTAHYLGA